MLTIQDFIAASPYYKLSILSVNDVLISMEDNTYQWDLYQVDSFYVEVRYLKKTQPDRVQFYMKAFSNLEYLEPYLQGVNIANLQR